MKIFGITLAVMLMLVGCSKDTLKELLPEMTATIDGKEWVSVTRVTVEKDSKFLITGTAIDGTVLLISTFGNTVGDYGIGLDSVLNIGGTAVYKESINASADVHPAFSGKVNLSEVNTTKQTISGTFNLTLTNGTSSMEVTSGKFSRLKYTIQ